MIQAICWVLVHSLWQGVLLALAGGGVILCTKRSAAAVRYRLLCGLLGVFLAGMGLTFIYEWTIVTGAGGGGNGVVVSLNWFGEWCSAHAYPLVTVWLILVVVKSVRVAAGWSYLRRMRREGSAAPAMWVEKVSALSRQLGMRRTVKLVESALVRVPVVIGQLKPIVYIPLGLINHLPASEMEAVLLHELAHIRRYDHVVNMVQQVVECLLFFNPGYLWISSLLREERENCCDDIAIAHTRDRVEFVRALVRFSEHSLGSALLAFPGNKRQLLHRVLRISRQENKTLGGRERLVLLGGCILLLCLLAVRVGRAVKLEEQAVKVEGQAVKTEGREVRVAEVRRVSPVQPELMSVLRAQQQVAQNMEWVEAQLEQLHRKPDVKKKNGRVSDMKKKSEGVKQEKKQDWQEGDPVQTDRDREQAERDRMQAEQDRIQAGRDLEQADRDRRQADLDRGQAERDREQWERNREQLERNRAPGKINNDQALRNLEQAARDREQAARNRVQAEQERRQAELDRLKADLERTKADQDRTKADHVRAAALGAASGQKG